MIINYWVRANSWIFIDDDSEKMLESGFDMMILYEIPLLSKKRKGDSWALIADIEVLNYLFVSMGIENDMIVDIINKLKNMEQ